MQTEPRPKRVLHSRPDLVWGTGLAKVTQRVQVPIIQGFWTQKPFRIWRLRPESSNIGYVDHLGKGLSFGWGLTSCRFRVLGCRVSKWIKMGLGFCGCGWVIGIWY